MKKICCFLSAVICLICCFIFSAHQIQAATRFEVINVSDTAKRVGNVTFFSERLEDGGWRRVYYKVGNAKKRLSTDEKISTIIMTDGKKAYYSVIEDAGANYYETVFEKELSTGRTKKIFSLKDTDSFCFAGYYQGEIYYTKNLDPGTLCSYNLKTEKNKSLLSHVTSANQYGNVFLCIPYEGAGGPLEFQLYNAKTNKAKMLTKNMLRYQVIRKQIYYVDCVKEYGFNDYVCNVVSCDLNGKNKKILLKHQRIKGYIEKISSSYITYKDYDADKIYKIKYS